MAAVIGGAVQVTPESVVAGVPIRFPMVDVHSVGAGGGSVAWLDEGGALRVGPRSAGALPSPACYGRGGEEPTVTDANLVLGYLADGAVLGGEVRLDRALADRALAGLADATSHSGSSTWYSAVESASSVSQGRGSTWYSDVDSPSQDRGSTWYSAGEAALGVVRVADAEIVRALRVITVERGLDPRDFALLAFGGAGPLHACSLAEELGIRRVLVPRASGVLSALGLAVADLRRDYVAPVAGPQGQSSRLSLPFEPLEELAARHLPKATLTRLVDARYRSQSYELTVPAADWEREFGDAHERRYGFRMESEAELVNLRLVATHRRPRPTVRPEAGSAGTASRRAFLDGDWIEVPVHGPGAAVVGPALVELAEATCLVRPGWSGEPDAAGTLVLERTWTP